jgi:hypothetical protein
MKINKIEWSGKDVVSAEEYWKSHIMFEEDEGSAEIASFFNPSAMVFYPEGEPFEGLGMVVNSGEDSQFILPLRYGGGTAHHELTIDWGDGEIQETTGTAGITDPLQGLTHTYPAANKNFVIKITGTTYLETADNNSYFGLGFFYTTGGYNVIANKSKVRSLFGSPDFLFNASMPSRGFCYAYMFYGCTGITELPATLLPATTMASNCYQSMFYGCTGLTELPATLLPATTMGYGCYTGMFYGCTGLTFIYMSIDWFTGKTAQPNMFGGCSNITANTPYADIPSGWK